MGIKVHGAGDLARAKFFDELVPEIFKRSKLVAARTSARRVDFVAYYRYLECSNREKAALYRRLFPRAGHGIRQLDQLVQSDGCLEVRPCCI